MKQKLLLKTMLLLCALIAGSSSVWADDYELYSGTITEGDYVIVYDGVAMKNTVSSSRIGYQSVTISDDKISNPGAAIVWHIAASGDYWTIYNASVEKYAGGSTTKNAGALLEDVTDYAKWSVTGSSTYDFENKGRAGGSSNTGNKWLRYNSSYGFAPYASGTGGALSLYKKVEATGAATTVTINSTGITNTNKFNGTAAGTLTAAVTVTATSAAVAGATVTWSSDDESVATVGETTGVVTLIGEGTTTITASYAGKSGEYKSSSAEYVLNVTNENPNAVTLWSEDFSSYSADDVPSGGTYNYVCADNGTNITKIYDATMAGGSSPELLVGRNGGSFSATVPLENIVGDMKLKFKSNVYAVTVSTSTEGISISGDAAFNAAGEHTVTFTGVTTSKTSVTITFSAGNSNNVRIDDIVLKGSKVVPVTIASSGYSTLASAYGLDFSTATPAGLEAYVASEVTASGVTLAAVNEAPASTGVILKGTAGENYTIPVKAAAAAVGTNYLHAAVTAYACTANEVYILQGGLFHLVNAASTVPAGKAYLLAEDVPVASAPGYLGFDFGGTTGVNEVKGQKEEVRGEYYNLAGQRVANPTKGLYIVNGRKVVIK